MANNIKMIVCDLDGTLLNNHKVVSDHSIQKLIEYQKKGIRVTLASGRYYKEVERFAKQLRLEEFGGYVVCGNGYEIHDLKNHALFTFDTIPPEIVKDCIDLANECHLMQYISIDGIYHLSTNTVEKAGVKTISHLLNVLDKAQVKQISYASHLLRESVFEKDLKPFIQKGIVKICVIGTPKNQNQWIERLHQKYPHYFGYYPVNPVSLEITHSSVSKKHAVETIAQNNGFTLQEVIAFGDSGNDEPLLLNAGIGITMKNGTKRALSKAKIISEFTNHEDGVIRECEKYIQESSRR